MPVRYTILGTDWGYMQAGWTQRGLWEIDFPRAVSPECSICQEEDVLWWSQQLTRELNMYWRGFFTEFSVPIDWQGYTPFRAAVLRYTATIPYGQTITYQEAARAAGSPKAARAAGGALHNNRTPIVVPCHRVVGADGSLTGFGGGLELKRALLLLEGGRLPDAESELVQGKLDL
jgi:methylated-DNA-[protein]-cysteine S-methyltransferase